MNLPLSRKSTDRRQSAGFSLVEVVLAVGVISFAFVAILGLLPAGLQQFRQAMDTSVAAQISQRVIQDAQLTDFNTLTHPDNPTSTATPAPVVRGKMRYFDEQGNEVIPLGSAPSPAQMANIVYHVNSRIVTSTVLPSTANATLNASLASITVQVAFNPSGRTINVDGSTFLFSPTLVKQYNIPVKTYSAFVGRND